MSGTYKTKTKKPCGCGANRWKTVKTIDDGKVSQYGCRKCGGLRNVTKVQAVEEGTLK